MRYPGGKSRAVPQILPFFPQQPSSLCSPFFGGGSLEIALAARGWRVNGCDTFAPLIDFWQHVLTDAPSLADAAAKYLPLDKQTFQRLQMTRFATQFESAVAFFVLNRSSFSGSTMSGGMSPSHPRFTTSAIQRLRDFHARNVRVQQADFTKSIPEHPDAMLYCDPPYPDAKSLYGNRGSLHDRFDHDALCELLRSRDNWILSYSNCPQVQRMYEGYEIAPLTWSYGMSADKRSR